MRRWDWGDALVFVLGLSSAFLLGMWVCLMVTR